MILDAAQSEISGFFSHIHTCMKTFTYILFVSLERQVKRDKLVRVTSYGVDIVEQHMQNSNSTSENMDGSV